MTTENDWVVYRLWAPSSPLEYYGSTTQKLSQRLGGHARDLRKWQAGKGHYLTSFEIMKLSDARIELVEVVDTKSKQVLKAREGYYIRTNDCVNKNIAGRTHAESCAAWYTANREAAIKKRTAYNAEHRDEIASHNGLKLECACGGKHTHGHTAAHKKTKKHRAYAATLAA